MTRRGAVCTALLVISLVSAAPPRPAAAAEFVRAPAASQLVLQKGELSLLARVVQREAENQPAVGQRAVAWTAVNRLRAGGYGRTLRDVLLARHQYAAPKPPRPDSPAYRAALAAALAAVKGTGGDPGLGATHFIRCDMRRKPAWTRKLTMTVHISSHCFYSLKAPRHD
jgi:N-acetylmuramoyl-L-alanine amidase